MSGFSGMMGMLGPMLGGAIGGAAGSAMQPGSRAKDGATAGMLDRTAAFQQAVQSNVAKQEASGWDRFLSGTAQFAGNYLRGLATGLAAYDERNPYSSFAGAVLGASPGMQARLDASAQEFKAEQVRQRSVADMMAKSQAEEGIYRSQVERAAVMPDLAGVVAGIKQAPIPKASDEPFGIKIGYGQTAAARTLGLVK